MAKIENTLESLDALIDKMREKGLAKLSYSDGDFDITLEMPTAQTVVSAPALQTPPVFPTPVPAAAVSGSIVKSPIVGTFYIAPAPDKEPFVKVGQAVKKGDVLMIIESMKLMNEITSEYDGTVAEIMVCSGTAVEFDQPIMRIE